MSGYLVLPPAGSGGTGAGPTGPQGATGARGVTGTQGPQGSPGVTGPAGAGGSGAGVTGPQGAQGSPGVTGAAGAAGSAGVTGPQGSQGLQGVTGAQGSQGSPGAPGTQGATGPAGAGGSQGATGVQGPQGIQGATGTQGIQGATGVQGATGPAGSGLSLVPAEIVFGSAGGTETQSASLVWTDSLGTLGIGATGATGATGPAIVQFGPNSVPQVTQSNRLVDLPVNDIVITTQAPFASASTNKSSANFTQVFPTPVSGGTQGGSKGFYGSSQAWNLNGTNADFISIGGTLGSAAGNTAQSGYFRFSDASQTIMSVKDSGGTDRPFMLIAPGVAGFTLGSNQFPTVLNSSTTITVNGNVSAGFLINFLSAPTISGPVSLSGAAGTFTLYAGTSNSANTAGSAMVIQSGAGSGTGLLGAWRACLGTSTSNFMIDANQVVASQRVLGLVGGSALTSTQLPSGVGDRVIYIAECATAPTANASGGGLLWVSTGGALMYRSPAGTVTTIAAA